MRRIVGGEVLEPAAGETEPRVRQVVLELQDPQGGSTSEQVEVPAKLGPRTLTRVELILDAIAEVLADALEPLDIDRELLDRLDTERQRGG